jgi:hypothetical protein
LKQLASRVGEVVKVELKAALFGNGEFHIARVLLEADKPLMRIVSLSPKGSASLFVQVVFEKQPKLCDQCGLMGHVVLECGTGEFLDEQIQYGDWMLAPMETWHPETPRVRGGSSREREAFGGGRGMGGGRQGGWANGGGSGWAGARGAVEVAERECGGRRKQEIQRDPQGKGLLVKRDWKGNMMNSPIQQAALLNLSVKAMAVRMGRLRCKNSCCWAMRRRKGVWVMGYLHPHLHISLRRN